MIEGGRDPDKPTFNVVAPDVTRHMKDKWDRNVDPGTAQRIMDYLAQHINR